MRARPLSSRLFRWFFVAIFLAIVTSALIVGTTRPDAGSNVESVARHISSRLAEDWDNPAALDAYVDQVRDVTGFDVRLVRDVRRLPPHVRRVAERGGALAPAGGERTFVPVVRDGVFVGALEMNRWTVPRPATLGWSRLALALVAVMAVLSVLARRVAGLLALPLEGLSRAADRLGAGDLTSRAEVGRARRWIALEVRNLAVSFNRMADRVETMVRGQRELLGAISHELRSPLGRARVALEIARDRLPDGAADARAPASALDDVEAQLGAIDDVLGDLLDLTRAGLADLHRESRDFTAWIRERAAEQPAPPETALEVAPDVEGAVVSFDPALLGRVVQNLLVNARAHGHDATQPLVLAVSRSGDRVRVAVRDRGPGFPDGFADRAFEPFARADAARSRPTAGAGYGLGLTIVRRIVEAHGGRAFARNLSRGGAEVGFDLPLGPPSR
ncbi:MAG TPA: ATP-binding protein [Polyangiaceae bacterium]|jgi:signal transduction histidine kinase